MDTVQKIRTWVEFGVLIFGIFGGAWLKRWIIKRINKWYDHFKRNRDQWQLFTTHSIDEIKKQVFPNGGNSLYDKVLDIKFGQRVTWEALKVAMWESDKNGKVIYVTPGLCHLIGCNTEDVLNNSWINRVVYDDRERVFKSWQFSIINASEFNETYTYAKDDGNLQTITATAVHNVNDEGKVISSKGWLIKVGEPFKR